MYVSAVGELMFMVFKLMYLDHLYGDFSDFRFTFKVCVCACSWLVFLRILQSGHPLAACNQRQSCCMFSRSSDINQKMFELPLLSLSKSP